MMKNKNPKVEIIDDNHVFIDNRQFVSLKRFAEVKMDGAKEIKLLNEKNKELAKENEALRTLLWNQYHEVNDTCSTGTCSTQDNTTNKITTNKFSLNEYLNDMFDAYDTYLNTSNTNNNYKNNFYISDYCKDCPNNPANGGDGVCNCAVDAALQITL